MNWHGQINRTIWEIETLLDKKPESQRLRRELLRTQFLQRYEFDRSHHIARDDRSFLFMQEDKAPAALLLHGAHGTPAEMRDLGNYLYSKGFTVFCPRLSRYDVKNRMVTWESWVTAAETALTSTIKYSERTLVVGLSLGGTVSILLQRMHPVKGVVLLAPALYPKLGFKGTMLSVLRRIVPPLFYRIAGWNGEAVKAMDYIRKTTKQIETPALAVQAKDDGVLSSKGLKFLKKKSTDSNSAAFLLDEGSHALTRGSAKEEVFERTFEFARQIRLIGGRAGGGRPQGRPSDGGIPGERPSRGGRPRRRGSRGGRGRRRSSSGESRPDNRQSGSGDSRGDNRRGGSGEGRDDRGRQPNRDRSRRPRGRRGGGGGGGGRDREGGSGQSSD